jgi:hypothetical protein
MLAWGSLGSGNLNRGDRLASHSPNWAAEGVTGSREGAAQQDAGSRLDTREPESLNDTISKARARSNSW